jgi:hypothetical protein
MGSLSEIVSKFCSLRAAISSSSSEDIQSAEILARALAIDADFATWNANLPDEVLPSAVELDGQSSAVHSDHYDVYCDISAATLLNHYRSIRILTHETIFRQSTYLCQTELGPYAKMHDQLHRSKALMKQFIDEICASVPFYMDLHPHLHECSTANSTMSRTGPVIPRAVGGNAIIWPLFVAADCDICDNETRLWIMARLQDINTEMRVRQAAVLAKILLEKKEVTDLLIEKAKDVVNLETQL